MKKKMVPNAYSLIPSQQTMYFMLKYSLHKQVMQIPMSLTVNQKLDFDVLQKAVEIECERNDSMRLRYFKEKGEVKQYFLPEYKIGKIPVVTFKSKDEQEKYLTEDAQKPIRFLKDEVYRIIFFRSYNGGSGIYINVCHLSMDATAVFLFFTDVLNVYNALKDGKEMPEPLYSFKDIIDKEFKYLANKERYAKDEAFYREYFLKDGEPFYAGVHGMDLLEKERKKKKNPNLRVPSAFDPIHDKANLMQMTIPKADADKIMSFCKTNNVSPACLIQMGLRTHVSKINERNPDVYFMELCNRRVTYKDKLTGGCVTQPLPVRAVISEDKTFDDALQQLSDIRTQVYRHMNYPYMASRHLVQEMFNYGMTASPSSMMFTWLPLEFDCGKNWEYEFTGYSMGRYIMPLYAFSMPNLKTGGIDFYYMYRTNTISEEQIKALHKGALNTILKGIKNPSITVGQLLNTI
ncbi:MAG: hypothetical protein GX264_07640 [Clostridiales bacterium]|jgi:hypothetical protein|nr:hypothetical protein [Clostridiales bacterium]